MRRTLVAVAMGAMVLIGSACQPAPTEPAMTITAKNTHKPTCNASGRIEGVVTPLEATKEVVLQRTVDGKWVDWKWWEGNEEASWAAPHLLKGYVQQFEQGYYSIDYLGSVKPSTLHLRVRSSGGTKFSPGIYVTSTC